MILSFSILVLTYSLFTLFSISIFGSKEEIEKIELINGLIIIVIGEWTIGE